MTDAKHRHPNVVRAADVPARTASRGDRFALASRPLGKATGAQGIGCSLYEIPPGKTAFPHHYHCVNEEAVYILEGSGTLRIGADEVPVYAGDYATFPVGPAHCHQLLNTGESVLKYLCLSTLRGTDICGYPDSAKIGAYGYGPAGEQWIRVMTREGESLDYYDGELG